MTPKILCFAGSTRKDSLNKKLARVAAACVSDAGAEATRIDLRDFPMPLYDGDLESAQGVPDHALRLKALFRAHDALLIVSPENNSSVSAVLKNALDWLSRDHLGEAGTLPYKGKVAALMAASPGALGGLRGLVHLRQILQNLSVLVLSEQFALARAHEAFDGDDRLRDSKQLAAVAAVAQRLVDVTRRMAG